MPKISIVVDQSESFSDHLKILLTEQLIKKTLPCYIEPSASVFIAANGYIVRQLAEIKKKQESLRAEFDELQKILGFMHVVEANPETDLVAARKWCRQQTKCSQRDGSKWRFETVEVWINEDYRRRHTRDALIFMFVDASDAMLFKLTFG